MPQQWSDGELVELLYAAAGEAKLWPQFLAAVSKRVEAPGVGLIFHCPSAKHYEVNLQIGLPPESLLPYAEHYGAVDAWGPAVRKLPEGTAELGSSLCPLARFRETEFYIDFLQRYRPFIYQCGVILENRDGAFGILSCLRELGQRDFSKRHIQFLSKLSGHLRQALAIQRRILDGEQALAASASAVDRFDAGLILVTGDGRVCFANRQGEAVLQAGRFFILRSGKLVCRDTPQALSFQRLLRTAGSRHLETVSGGAITLHAGKQLLYVTVIPHAGDAIPFSSRPVVAVVLSDPAMMPKSREHLLRDLFRLTPAETRVAMLLVQGLETRAIAEETGNTEDTVRFHLKKIYGKTKISRQSQLVRIISQLPGEA